MKITMNAIIKRKRARFYPQKTKKLRNVFIYKKLDTFQRARQFPLRFYIQKAINLTLRDFNEIFEVGYIQKARHFAKSKTTCDTFYIQKPGTFALHDFSLNF